MKYCSNCGTQLADNANYCPNCGKAQSQQNYYNDQTYLRNSQQYTTPSQQDGKSFGIAILGFLIPIVGLILYLVWKDEMPLKAKSAGKGALVSVIFYAVAIIASVILLGIAVSMGGTDPSTIIDFEEQFGADIPSLFI